VAEYRRQPHLGSPAQPQLQDRAAGRDHTRTEICTLKKLIRTAIWLSLSQEWSWRIARR